VNELISRRAFLRAAALGSAALAVKTRVCAQPAKLPRKPNLLVFLPDQLARRRDRRRWRWHCARAEPSQARLAVVIFERSLLSGTWPHQNGCTGNKSALSRKFLCLPELIGDPDYRTGYFGKWYLGDEFSAQRGFEEWTSIEEYSKSADGDRKIEGLSDYSKFLLQR
jgi:hypothetical protein